MLTSLKVSGFKNLRDCHVMFGPFTCIAGANGAGKSNLFDVIGLLKNLSQMPLIDAFSKIRNEEGQRSNNLSSAFFKTSTGYSDLNITAEFIVKNNNTDDFTRIGTANSNFLRYELTIRYKPASDASNNINIGLYKKQNFETIELCSEELTFIKKEDVKKRLCFTVSKDLFNSLYNNNRSTPYISVKENKENKDNQAIVIKLHQESTTERRARGRPLEFPATGATRTVLSIVNSIDTPTALAAKREMQSWLQLQLEPSSLRAYDSLKDPDILDEYGRHLPGTLNRLNNNIAVTNKLAALVPNIHSVQVDIDEIRQNKTIEVVFKNSKKFTANNLSDGTLRFLALSALALDKKSIPVICMEEPENGIHPEKIPALLLLLQEIAFDTDDEINDENPLRQVIINTHSPVVVKHLKTETLLFAENYNVGTNSFVKYLTIKNNVRTNSNYSDFVSDATLIKYLGENIKSLDKNKPSRAYTDKNGLTVAEYVNAQSNLEFEG
jgi:predicted ATPase